MLGSAETFLADASMEPPTMVQQQADAPPGERYQVVVHVDAAVLEGNPMPFALLGMSFLNRMEMKREGQTMVLIRRF